jgi:hypothetical protein
MVITFPTANLVADTHHNVPHFALLGIPVNRIAR